MLAYGLANNNLVCILCSEDGLLLDAKLYQIATLDAVCSLLCLFLLHLILSHI